MRLTCGSCRDARGQPSQRADWILVPGQVADDASIKFGCRDIRTNEELLAEVRRQLPGRRILYKPHPDVVAGNREGGIEPDRISALTDAVVTDVDIISCLPHVCEVHTMTSLAGFEALVHGIPVVTYGLPFYAGWGLTRDRHLIDRRKRTLSLDALITGSLALYPTYRDQSSGCFIPVEAAVQILAAAGKGRALHLTRNIYLQQLVRLFRAVGFR